MNISDISDFSDISDIFDISDISDMALISFLHVRCGKVHLDEGTEHVLLLHRGQRAGQHAVRGENPFATENSSKHAETFLERQANL